LERPAGAVARPDLSLPSGLSKRMQYNAQRWSSAAACQVIQQNDSAHASRVRGNHQAVCRKLRPMSGVRHSSATIAGEGASSPIAIAHASAAQVVRAHLNPHAITEQNSDAESPHLAAGVGQQLVSVIKSNRKL